MNNKRILLVIFIVLLGIIIVNFASAMKCCFGTKINTCHELDWMHFSGGCQAAYKCENGKCGSCFFVGVNPGSNIERCRTSPGCCGWGLNRNICGSSSNEDCNCEVCNCGDGIVQSSAEECDNGAGNSDTLPDACRTNCKRARCGDKVIDTGEECDDGNTDNGDKCSSTCKIELKFKSIDLFLNKDYIRETIERRGFTPKPIFNPFSDIVCEVIVEVPDGTQEPESFSGRLTTGKNENLVEIASGTLIKINKEDPNCPNCEYYQWNITGWINGWIVGWTNSLENMNSLIQNKKVSCNVSVDDEDKEVEKPISACVHISGRDMAVINVLYYRDASLSIQEMSHQVLVIGGERIASLGFNEIAPFKQYKAKFSHYVDLEENACKKDERIIERLGNIFKQLPPDKIGEAEVGKKKFFIDPDIADEFITAIHETGHAFCWLEDEYIPRIPSVPEMKTNCRNENFWPAEFGGQIQGCTNNDFFRSTQNSIMNNDHISQQFNIVSCGYCLKEIDFRKKNITAYWRECSSLSVVKPAVQNKNSENAEESCYIELNVNENKTAQGIIFSLISQENVYGAYSSSIVPYDEDNYEVISYDNNGNILSNQGVNSARFVFWDGLNDGGVDELNEANHRIIVPYYSNIAFISIKNKENEQFLSFNSILVKCEKTCKIAGETGMYGIDSCCLGFNAVPKNKTDFICTNPEDATRDGRVNILDLIFVRARLGQNVITGNDILADINNDDRINILDLIDIRSVMSSA